MGLVALDRALAAGLRDRRRDRAFGKAVALEYLHDLDPAVLPAVGDDALDQLDAGHALEPLAAGILERLLCAPARAVGDLLHVEQPRLAVEQLHDGSRLARALNANVQIELLCHRRLRCS